MLEDVISDQVKAITMEDAGQRVQPNITYNRSTVASS